MANKTYFHKSWLPDINLWNVLGALIQRKMPIVNFVNVLWACQTWLKRHYVAMLMERNMVRRWMVRRTGEQHTLPKHSIKLQSQWLYQHLSILSQLLIQHHLMHSALNHLMPVFRTQFPKDWNYVSIKACVWWIKWRFHKKCCLSPQNYVSR